jgi:protein required for attachment to host cells
MAGKINTGTVVVVADGTVAKFFVNKGNHQHLRLKILDELHPTELLDDGPAGKRPPESSQQETDEATFAKQLAHHLYDRWNRERFDSLVIVADPETLGQLRPSLHQEISSRTVLELPKTLTNSPVDEMETSLNKALFDD